jgi:hypothetical protein
MANFFLISVCTAIGLFLLAGILSKLNAGDKIMKVTRYLLLGSVVCAFMFGVRSCKENEGKISKKMSYNNGNLDNSFRDSTLANKLSIKDSLLKSGWDEQNIPNGAMPTCYNFKSKVSKIKNKLDITVGNTDVVVKLIDLSTNQCIRYVYVNRATSYAITNIPQGKYYLKIAYGSDWVSSRKNGECLGKFTEHALYEKGIDIFDFNIKYRDETSYQIPSYSLHLDVIHAPSENSFSTGSINEAEFNK